MAMLATADDRASAINVGLPFGRIYPTPDGALADAQDRQQIAFLYRGIAVVYRILAPVGVYIPRFRVMLFRPLPSMARTDAIDINPEVTTLNWSSGVPGGFRKLNVGTPNDDLPHRGRLPEPTLVWPRGFVRVMDGSAVCFEGVFTTGNGPRGSYGFSADGPGIAAMADGYSSSDDTTSSTTGTVLAAAIAAGAPLLTVGGNQEWQDPQTEHTLLEVQYRTPAGVAQQFAIEGGIGDAGNQVWDFTVYEGLRAGFWPRDMPSRARYLIPFDETVTWTEYYDQMYSGADLLYTVAGITTLLAGTTTPGFEAEWGFSRTALLTAGEMTAASAQVYVSTWLAARSKPRITVSIARNLERGLERWSGAEDPCWLVRAGGPDMWVQIGEGNANDPVLPIVQTSFDANTMAATFELGIANPEEFGQNLADLCSETTALGNYIDPTTFTKTRV